MSRKPFDEVAATMTTTVRLTPDDRARIDRQIATRTDLPEPSISALLRRLVRCADEGLAITLPREERTLLEMLVRHRAAELQRLGVVDANTALSSLVIRMIRDTAAAHGFALPPAPSEPAPSDPAPSEPTPSEPTTNAPTTSTTAESTAHKEPAKVAPPLSHGLDAAAVQAALRTAVDEGASQRSIARRAEIDPGQLSRFLREGAGLSSERLSRLASALEKKA